MLSLNHQHLYYFWVVAREGSVSAACRKLFLAQPTVSGQIIQLEKSLGHKLFSRERNKLQITPEGRVVKEFADEIFGTSRKLLEALKETSKRGAARLRLGIDANITKAAALQLLKAIRTRGADINLHIEEGRLSELLELLRARDLDLVLCEHAAGRAQIEGYLAREIGRLDIFFVAAPEIARQVQQFPRDLAKIPLLMPPPESPLRGDVERFLVKYGIQPSRRWLIQHADFAHQLALAGEGAAPLHEISVSADLKAGRLVRLGRQRTGITKTLWLLSLAQRLHPLVNHLMRHFEIH
jgi:LysR family transcriptional regulator, transcriptional activator of nhaA